MFKSKQSRVPYAAHALNEAARLFLATTARYADALPERFKKRCQSRRGILWMKERSKWRRLAEKIPDQVRFHQVDLGQLRTSPANAPLRFGVEV